MEKSRKVLKNIHKTVAPITLGKKNNDECYTSMQDIMNELMYWANLDKFRGKRIICPCDWDIADDSNIYSIEITYKDSGIDVIGNNVFKAVDSVKLGYASDYIFNLGDYITQEDEPGIVKVELHEDEIEEFLRDKLKCNFVRTLTQNARAWGIKSITASGYNPITEKGIKFQNVDYSKYDICITNPPFSLYGEFMKAIVGKIDFICLAPFLNRVNISIGLPLMLRQAYLGFGVRLGLLFENPTSVNNYTTKSVACDWITSFNDAQLERNKIFNHSGVKYELYKDEYKIMTGMTMKDGTHPIKVPGCQVPEDYTGWMFTDIGFLDKVSFDEYEWYVTRFCRYYNTDNPSANPFAHKASNAMLKLDDKNYFGGIVIRKKSN